MERCSPCPMLCPLAFLLFLQLPTVVSIEEFLDPIIAVVGDNIKLPCCLFPVMNAENMELRWFCSKLSEAVYIYQNHGEETEEQLAQYTGRTSLDTDLLFQGQCNMHIHKVQISDAGRYICSFRKEGFSKRSWFGAEGGVNSGPQVHITGPEEDGVHVVLRAAGWFPKPQVQWRDSSGGKSLAFSETHTQDPERLFSVEAVLVVRDSTVGNMTCSILNPIMDQEKAMVVFRPDELQTNLDHRKAEYLADWRKDMFQTWPVTLDPGSASPGIVVYQKNTSLTLKDTVWELEGRCSILGLEGITSGRCCWEVEIRKGDRSLWALGVCREDVKRTGWYQESPHKEFWVVGNSEDGFNAFTTPLTAHQVPHRVGVFLDPEKVDVFYNMTDGSQNFSFSQTSFSGTLFLYFMIYSGDMSLSICSVVGGPELSVPIKSFPFSQEESVSSHSGVDGAPPGPKSPLLG